MMWEWLLKTSAGALLATVPRWAYYLVLALALVLAGGYANGVRWDAKYTKLADAQMAGELQAQADASRATQANASASGAIDAQKYEELKHAKQTIADLRSELRAGTLRLRASGGTTNHAENHTGSSVGDGQTPDTGTSAEPVGQDILTLAEYAKTAIVQRDYLQDKHRTDIATVNSVGDSAKK